MSAFIAESTWVNRAHYEGAWDAYQVFKATGKTVQVSTTGLQLRVALTSTVTTRLAEWF